MSKLPTAADDTTPAAARVAAWLVAAALPPPQGWRLGRAETRLIPTPTARLIG
jgi:hypothetical protein